MLRTNSQDCGDRILKEIQLKASSKVSRGKEVSPSSSGGSVNINRNENFGVDDDMDCDLDCVPEDDVCGGEQDDIKSRKRKDRKEIASRSVYWDHFDKYVCDIDKVQKLDANCQREIKADPRSEEVGLDVEKCLLDWGIDKVFTVTVDNASSNDDGLRNKEEHLAISRIRGAIRWNSTYLMLEAATCLKTQRAFSRFPILSKIARDILAVPVSTVASESAFSTGGRVLDAFRSSLSPKIVQALICAQDWLQEFDWNKPNRPIESLIAKSRTEAATEKIALRKTRCGTPVDFSATHSKFEKVPDCFLNCSAAGAFEAKEISGGQRTPASDAVIKQKNCGICEAKNKKPSLLDGEATGSVVSISNGCCITEPGLIVLKLVKKIFAPISSESYISSMY
ncbi:UNVERIFIED_CONTAM: putative AC transposase [Sesamum calycinum]|uniref:AC transposase n=1 Tax=Sesamum calycinum TaxID=2727403 RepID=A0AAW2R879_9LAMI